MRRNEIRVDYIREVKNYIRNEDQVIKYKGMIYCDEKLTKALKKNQENWSQSCGSMG